jgi:hypothetical protein
MKKLLLIFGIFLVMISGVEGSCSLGCTPLKTDVQGLQGEVVDVEWDLYNLYGDRLTHVLVSKSEGPDWDISYNPEAEYENYNVAGEIKTIKENLALEKKEVVNNPGNEDYVYLKHPNKEGYIPAKKVIIRIRIPENADIGLIERFKFQALGRCFGSEGMAVPGVASKLEVDLRVVSEFYEEKVGISSLGSDLIGAVINPVVENPGSSLMLGLTLVLAILFIILLVFKRGRKLNLS